MAAKQFNDMYDEFICKLHKLLPDEDNFLVLKDCFAMARRINSSLPVTWWVCAIHPFSEAIFTKNESFFLENKKWDRILKEHCHDLSGMDIFHRRWKDAKEKTRESIWVYFQNLLILGYEHIGLKVSFDGELLKKVYQTGHEYKPEEYKNMIGKKEHETVADNLKKRFAK